MKSIIITGGAGFIGSHVAGTPLYVNHHEKYDVDEVILHRGAAVAAQFAHRLRCFLKPVRKNRSSYARGSACGNRSSHGGSPL